MMIRDPISLPPPLHGGVVQMAQRTRQRADAAACRDEVSMATHDAEVRDVRTSVNQLDSVRAFCDYTYMAKQMTTGARLRILKERAGPAMTLEEIARRGGYAGKSSVQEYFKDAFEGPLSNKAAAAIAVALEGAGSPPITREEVLALAGERPPSNARTVQFEGASGGRMPSDMPVYGTALGAEKIVDGEAIEQTTLNRAEVIEYRKRPTISNGVERLYGLYVQGSSMYPAHRDGAFLYVQRDAPLRVGDDVVVYLRPRDETDDGETATCVLVKRLVKRSAQFVELEQFTPPKTFRIAMADVLKIDRVLEPNDYA